MRSAHRIPGRSPPRGPARWFGWIAPCCAVLCLLSCDRPDPQEPAPPAPAVTRVAEGEGVLLVVTLDQERASTSEILTLSVHTSYQPGLVLASPELAGQESLTVLESVRTPARRRTDGAVEQGWRISLEPDLPGPAVAPGVKLSIRDTRSGTLSYISTEPIPVEITSVLAPDDPIEVTELRSVPAPPPEGETIWRTIGAIAGGATFATALILGLGVVAVIVVRRRLRGSSITIARKRVNALYERADAMSATELMSAISECSRILRSAIAERASIPAHAMTDVELLASCPQLASIRDLDTLLPEIEHTLCSGITPDVALARTLFLRIEHALDELSTFVPTRYLQSQEVQA